MKTRPAAVKAARGVRLGRGDARLERQTSRCLHSRTTTNPPGPRRDVRRFPVGARRVSQALDPRSRSTRTHVHLLELPDSSLVAIDAILTLRQYDSLTTAAAAARANADHHQETGHGARHLGSSRHSPDGSPLARRCPRPRPRRPLQRERHRAGLPRIPTWTRHWCGRLLAGVRFLRTRS